MRGNNDQSYVAIDQFEFLASDTCDFEPKEAWPVEPPTTPAPTEPPGRKFFLENIHYACNSNSKTKY